MFTEFVERGLSVIPVHKSEKRPVLSDWPQFAHRLPTLEESEQWDLQFANFNIGVALGKASNLLCVDIDSDRKEILDACPRSAVIRKGQKGEARFFQFNPDIANERIENPNNAREGIDILAGGRQVVLPPSIHPITKKPYVWLTEDTLQNFDTEDLPLLSSEDLQKMRGLFGPAYVKPGVSLQGTFINNDPSRESPSGSQDRLKKLASVLILKNTPIDQGIKELIEYDNTHHKPSGYFSETGRHSDGQADPYSNAARFYTNILRYINRERIRKGEPPTTAEHSKIRIDVQSIISGRPSQKLKSYPQARGIMREFQEICTLNSHADQSGLSLGGSLVLMSGVCANRFASQADMYTVTPNLYVINVAPSSFGKEVSQRLLEDLLAETGVLGASNYKSGNSILHNLPKQQERVDVIDEISGLLRAMSAKGDWQKEMVEILCILFSKASGRYNGTSSMASGSRFGACWNPSLSILGSTTPAGFRESVTSNLEAKGLMPRFLTFFQDFTVKYREPPENDFQESEKRKEALAESIQKLFEIPKIVHSAFHPGVNLLATHKNAKNQDISEGTRYQPRLKTLTQASLKFQRELKHLYFHQNLKEPESFESAFRGRFVELILKLALLDTVSLSREIIEIDSMDWAKSVVETCWDNCRDMYEVSSASNEVESQKMTIVNLIRKKGVLTTKELWSKTRKLTKRQRDDILQDLLDEGVIECQAEPTAGRSKHTYFIKTQS